MDARELENLMRWYMRFYLNAYYVLFSFGDSLFISLISQREHNSKMVRRWLHQTSKDTINRLKRQPMQWEKIFANDISDKELISRIHKEILQLNNNNKTQLQMGKRFLWYISPKKIYGWSKSTWKDAQHNWLLLLIVQSPSCVRLFETPWTAAY